VVEPVRWHPAADRVTPQTIVVEQDRSVVPLSTWLVDAGAAVLDSDRVVQVLTPARSRITYPLELWFRETGADWVVRDGPERFRDGLAGFTLRWTGTRFAPDLTAAGAEPGDPPPGSGDLELQLSIVHTATDALELGWGAESAIRAVTGAEPTGWGVAEPVTQPWSRRELTAHCRDRAPGSSHLLVAGTGIIGRLSVFRVGTGVLERIQLCGPPAGTVDKDAIETLADDMADRARSLIVAAHPGRLHGLRGNAPTLPALPYGILIGRSEVEKHGARYAQCAPGSLRLIGSAPNQALWCRLDQGPTRPYEALHAILNHFGMTDEES
jgi:hypothetical protein